MPLELRKPKVPHVGSFKMRFALHNQIRIEAERGTKGQCPACGAALVAKCGTVRVPHWAHKGQRHCDPWWENETEWHRDWKQHFPGHWQEVLARSESREIHVADIKTPNGLVVEFQHSPISVPERDSREDFYGNMIWVLDGLRAKTDFGSFYDHVHFHAGKNIDAVRTVKINPLVPRITSRWHHARRPVYLDFGDDRLWQIPVEQEGWGKHVQVLSKVEFLSAVLEDRGKLDPMPKNWR